VRVLKEEGQKEECSNVNFAQLAFESWSHGHLWMG
jgi:hypothetical protein